MKCLNDKSIRLSLLLAVGCNGTDINTISQGGVICDLKLQLKKHLQWFICQLHANELPLWHLLKHFDGETTDYQAFSGKQLQYCEKLTVFK